MQSCRGARHGLTSSGKLARIQQQEAAVATATTPKGEGLEKSDKSAMEIRDEIKKPKEIRDKIKKSKKRKNNMEDLEDTSGRTKAKRTKA